MKLALGVALLLAACSHSAAPPAMAGAAAANDAAPSCAKVAEHVVGLVKTSAQAPQDAVDRMVGVFASRCEGDHWGTEARACFGSATSMQDASDRCAATLSKAQQDAIAHQMDQTFPDAPAEAAPPPPGAPMPAAAPRSDRGDPCDGGK